MVYVMSPGGQKVIYERLARAKNYDEGTGRRCSPDHRVSPRAPASGRNYCNCPHGFAGNQPATCLLAFAQTTPGWLDSHAACRPPGLLHIGLPALSVLPEAAGEPS